MKVEFNLLEDFSKLLIEWYERNKRDLPWRNTYDPYEIWVSEIILQQTRVNQGLSYYLRFLEKFPHVEALSSAKEEDVLKLWQGLGYYSRGRNMHQAAQYIMKAHGGQFPSSFQEIRLLKGVGDYTAAAISSFAYNLPHATVDGNVYRVLSRVFGISTPIDTSAGKKEFATLAQNLLDKKKPGLYNQAIMEFGALNCTPLQPLCDDCILHNSCFAYTNSDIASLPKKQGKVKQRNRFFNYLFVKNRDDIYLKKRDSADVWQHLYEFPLIESDSEWDTIQLVQSDAFKKIFENISDLEFCAQAYQIKHVLSHQIIKAKFYIINIGSENENLKQYLKIPLEEVGKYPVSRLIELFLEA